MPIYSNKNKTNFVLKTSKGFFRSNLTSFENTKSFDSQIISAAEYYHLVQNEELIQMTIEEYKTIIDGITQLKLFEPC